MKISVVTPAYKCAESLKELHRRLVLTLDKITPDYEIIMVNDASPENDWAVIREICALDKRVKGINFSRNFGQHFAISAGLDYTQGEWVVVMDADLQDQPEEIAKLYNKALEGYEIVLCRRQNRKDGLFKRITSKVFSKIYGYFIEQEVDSSIANFGIYQAKVIDSVRRMKEHSRCFPVFISWLGFNKAYIDVEHSERFAGTTAYNMRRMVNLAIDIIVSQSNKPLKLSIKVGVLISLAAFLFGLWIVVRVFYFGSIVEGWASLMVSVWFIAGLLFANMGLLGLYIGKIFDESKNRPIYVIKDFMNVSKNKESYLDSK